MDFGVGIWLDDEAVYSESSAAARWHEVAVERPYGRGEHLLGFEILAARSSPGTYFPAWTIEVEGGNSTHYVHAPPTLLSVGQRFTARVNLAALHQGLRGPSAPAAGEDRSNR